MATEFKIQNGVLYGVYCTDAEIRIPDGVLALAPDVFRNSQTTERVYLPDSVESIGAYAFSGCTELTSVRLPANLTELAPSIFSNCKKLRCLEIPSSVSKIGEYAFWNCTSLESLTLPEPLLPSMTCYDGCFGSPTMIDIPYPIYALHRGFLSLRHPSLKVAALRGFAAVKMSGGRIDEDVRRLYLDYLELHAHELYEAAVKHTELLKLLLSEKLIPDADLDFLEHEVGGEDVELRALFLAARKPTGADNDFSLEFSLDEPKEEAVGSRAEWACEEVEGGVVIRSYKGREAVVQVPERIGRSRVVAIAPYAFSPEQEGIGWAKKAVRRAIREIRIPEGVKQIGARFVWGCVSLTRITLPSTLEYIAPFYSSGDANPFLETSPSLIVSVSGVGERYRTENGILYDLIGRRLLFCSTQARGFVEVLDGTGTIVGYAFDGCAGITELSLPESLRRIELAAFRGCASLGEVRLPSGLEYLGATVFDGCRALTRLTLAPDAKMDKRALQGIGNTED